MPETTGNRAQENFILSIRGLDDSWAATRLQDLIKKEQKDEDFPPITDLIAEFRSYYRRTRPIASGLGTFATLEVSGSRNSQEALQGAQTGGKRQLGSPTKVPGWREAHVRKCNGVRRGGELRFMSSYGGVQLYICVCGVRKGGTDSRTQLVAEWILARTKPLQKTVRTLISQFGKRAGS
jgi:hypothetical protein